MDSSTSLTDLLPMPVQRMALFLDFDGTLVDLAERPEDVDVPAELPLLLKGLSERLDGALAIVTGRPLAAIDGFLGEGLAAAGIHGLERRDAHGRTHELPFADIAPAVAALTPFVQAHPGTLLEPKHGAVALHYRQVPDLADACQAALLRAVQGIPGLALLHGKSVVEAKPAAATKGGAIATFMGETPFAGRKPVFFGDDETDESGFAWVQMHGGIGVKVGAGPSRAQHRVAGPAGVRAWLLKESRSVAPAPSPMHGNASPRAAGPAA